MSKDITSYDYYAHSHSFCWRDDLVNRYESLWSLTHKFSLLNAINAIDLFRLFELDSEANKAPNSWNWKSQKDLRYLGRLDASKLTAILNLKESFIMESLVSSFVKKSEIDTLSCETLRFCKSCLQSGFHSALHQLLFIDKCPVHKETFIDYCPKCLSKISYHLNNEAFKQPFGCQQCETIFCHSLSKTGGKLIYIKGGEASHKIINDWLLRRKENNTLELTLIPNSSDEIYTARKNKIISNLVFYWSSAFDKPDILKSFCIKPFYTSNKSNHIKIKINKSIENNEKVDVFEKSWDKNLYAIYKGIGRYFKKKILLNHLTCINSVGRKIWWGQHVLSCSGQICAYSNAFMLWRMYFEGINHPTKFFSKYKRYSSNTVSINWQPPSYDVSGSILTRLFAFECYWILLECLLIAKKFYLENTYTFNTFEIKKSYMPYWMFAQNPEEKSNRQISFNYWLENSSTNKDSSLPEIGSFRNIGSLIITLKINKLCPIEKQIN